MGCYDCHFCGNVKVIMRDTACSSCRKAGHKGANDDKAQAAQKRGQLKCCFCRKVQVKFAKTACSGCQKKGHKGANDHKVKAAQKRDQIKCCHCNKVNVPLARSACSGCQAKGLRGEQDEASLAVWARTRAQRRADGGGRRRTTPRNPPRDPRRHASAPSRWTPSSAKPASPRLLLPSPRPTCSSTCSR
eukprot:TRINITY_DN21213_c0_g1_i1.p2 TRINITY_DN21213_c0_g1~~TRINITY_DN21213_c0_g1_i1.p2  ORF type:complete len:189 (-),score=37.28 TRINITY_DN21213_c0_g1_i1:136-702(-)